MRWPKFNEVVGSIMTLGAMGVVSYAATVMKAPEALTALINVLMFGTGWFLRGKVQPPT